MKLVSALLIALVVSVVVSALSVIYSKHQTRKLFIELQQLHKEIDELNTEWGKLQLEQSTWSSHGRIEKIAREKLHMRLPVANEVLYIKQ